LFFLRKIAILGDVMEGYLAEIRIFAGQFAPSGWAFCQGQALQINTNQALYSLIGITYGGDAQTYFNLPNLSGRFPLGTSAGKVALGQTGGAENVTLSQAQMPLHTHSLDETVGVTFKNLAIPATTTTSTTEGSATPGATMILGPLSTAHATLYSSASNNTTLKPVDATGNLSATQVNRTPIAPTGGTASVPVLNPYLGVQFIICVEGIYPSRN
jgi:microcystin-dependent protein